MVLLVKALRAVVGRKMGILLELLVVVELVLLILE